MSSFASTDALTNTTVTSGANSELGAYVPEFWSDETLATYKANLVKAQLVVQMPHVGKKGDTVNIPTISARSTPTLRRPNSGNEGIAALEVNPTQVNPTLTPVLIDRHFEYSVLIEDFAAMQAKSGFRRFYTDDAGYALSTRVDFDLWLLTANSSYTYTGAEVATTALAGADWVQAAVTSGGIPTQRNACVIGSDGSTAWDDTANATTGNGAALADAGIRRMIRTLDDKNVPLSNRAFVIPPVEKESLLGIARFTEQAFTGETGRGNSIRNGLVGELYDNEVYVSSNAPLIQGSNDTTNYRVGNYLHKDAFVLIMQQRMRSQADYLLRYLSTLLVNDIAYGVKRIRGENFVPFVVPA